MSVALIKEAVKPYMLLQHDFYQAWNKGELTRETLQEYVCQYFRHVDDFPRYLSSIHTNCDDIKTRQTILGNLNDEEQGDENHPELWLRFAEGLGVSRNIVKNAKYTPETKDLTTTFFNLSKESVAEGIGGLYAYEMQTPDISSTKIDGLKAHYNVSDARSLQFFDVHVKADEWHSQELANVIEAMSPDEQEKAKKGAVTLAKALWGFLDGMHAMHLSKQYANIEMQAV